MANYEVKSPTIVGDLLLDFAFAREKRKQNIESTYSEQQPENTDPSCVISNRAQSVGAYGAADITEGV